MNKAVRFMLPLLSVLLIFGQSLDSRGGRYTASLLGNPLLWPYRVHMDFRSGRLILEKYPKS